MSEAIGAEFFFGSRRKGDMDMQWDLAAVMGVSLGMNPLFNSTTGF